MTSPPYDSNRSKKQAKGVTTTNVNRRFLININFKINLSIRLHSLI